MTCEATRFRYPRQTRQDTTIFVYPILTWQELGILTPKLDQKLAGARLERVRVPERSCSKMGYLRSEWVLEFRVENESKGLILSLDGSRCGLHLAPKGTILKTAVRATNHALEMQLRKELEGQRLRKMQAISGERWVLLSFGKETDPVDLWLSFIPAKRNAVLIRGGQQLYALAAVPTPFPPLERVGPTLPLRESLLSSVEQHGIECEKGIQEVEFESRRQALTNHLSQQTKVLKKRIASLDAPEKKKANPEDDSRSGHLLQSWLYTEPEIIKRGGKKYFLCGEDTVLFHETWGDARAHMQHYFDRAKKAVRGEAEHTDKRRLWGDTLRAIEDKLVKMSQIAPLDFQALSVFEAVPKTSLGTENNAGVGRMSLSPEGFLIQTGRNRTENLEITLKVARGNDLWFHVKGRPSAHTIIRLPPGKTASLETMLLAARLTLFYSGGRGWGKTEVDYTFRKHVKRIPGSTEVQYSQNKTLVVDCPEDFKPPEGSI